MKATRSAGALLLVVLVPLVQGCSLFGVPKPGPAVGTAPPVCNQSRTRPWLDVVGASMGLATGAWFVSIREAGDDFPSNADIGVTFGVAALFGLSSYLGFRNASECRDLLDEFYRERRTAPDSLSEPGRPVAKPSGGSSPR